MATGICLFLLGLAHLFTGKMGFGSLGLGLTTTKWDWEARQYMKKHIFHNQLNLNDIISSSVLSHSYDVENS